MATIEIETYNLDNPDRPTIPHDVPFGLLKYSEDWGPWCTREGVTIVDAVCVPETPLALGPSGTQFDANTVTAWIQGGTIGKTLRADFNVTFSDGQKDSRSIFLQCRNR